MVREGTWKAKRKQNRGEDRAILLAMVTSNEKLVVRGIRYGR